MQWSIIHEPKTRINKMVCWMRARNWLLIWLFTVCQLCRWVKFERQPLCWFTALIANSRCICRQCCAVLTNAESAEHRRLFNRATATMVWTPVGKERMGSIFRCCTCVAKKNAGEWPCYCPKLFQWWFRKCIQLLLAAISTVKLTKICCARHIKVNCMQLP